MQKLIVIGAGGFGRETLDVIEAINDVAPTFELLGVIDAHPNAVNLERLRQRRIQYLGADEGLVVDLEALFVVAIGSPHVRRMVAGRILSTGATPATLLHPRAGIGSASRIGRGSVICSGAQVSTNVSIGEHVHLNPNSTIGHDTVIGDCVSINPGAIVSGDVEIGRDTLIGAGAVVLQGLRIGSSSTVGAAACVTRDVGSSITVKGIPAR